MTDYCASCGAGFASEELERRHKCPPELVAHGRSVFGELGESTEAHELKRVRGLIGDEPPAPPSVPEIFEANAKKEMSLMVQAVVGELSRELRGTLAALKDDIDANTRLLGVMNAPMEAITGAHERATASFETLRSDIFRGGVDKLEKVLDTSGLTEAATKAETRIQALIDKLDKQITAAFTVNSDNMVKILHLLERLQARELRETKNRITRSAKRAVRAGPHV